MEPQVLDITEENNILNFTINNINVSFANAIRRVILSDIQTIVFKTFPHEKNDAEFIINKSRLNNEILKQRLSCIPIHISDIDMPIQDLKLEVDIQNKSDTIIYVTTEDFKIINLKTNKFLDEETTRRIFPPNNITKMYIDFCRLRPQISDNLPGEHLKFSCLFSINTAKDNGSFNVASTCTYRYTPDIHAIENEKSKKAEELELKYSEPADVEHHLLDWLNLDAKRIFIPDSFDFKLETVGVFTNMYIVNRAITNIINRLTIIQELYSSENKLIINSDSTLPNCFDIILENEDYTIGKVLEYILYKTYYLDQKTLSFCAFQKPHPHINISIIRLAFNGPSEKSTIVEYIYNSTNIAISIYKKLLESFNV